MQRGRPNKKPRTHPTPTEAAENSIAATVICSHCFPLQLCAHPNRVKAARYRANRNEMTTKSTRVKPCGLSTLSEVTNPANHDFLCSGSDFLCSGSDFLCSGSDFLCSGS